MNTTGMGLSDAVRLLDEFTKEAGALHPRQFDRLDAVRAILREKTQETKKAEWVLYHDHARAWVKDVTSAGAAVWTVRSSEARRFHSQPAAFEFWKRVKTWSSDRVAAVPAERPAGECQRFFAVRVVGTDDYVALSTQHKSLAVWSRGPQVAWRFPSTKAAMSAVQDVPGPLEVVEVVSDADGRLTVLEGSRDEGPAG